MNVVEAIDAWIDEKIDDLSDDELEVILQILDVVSASALVDLDTSQMYDEDIAVLVEEVGGDFGQRTHTESVLRSALFDRVANASADDAVEVQAYDDERETSVEDAHSRLVDQNEVSPDQHVDDEPEAIVELFDELPEPVGDEAWDEAGNPAEPDATTDLTVAAFDDDRGESREDNVIEDQQPLDNTDATVAFSVAAGDLDESAAGHSNFLDDIARATDNTSFLDDTATDTDTDTDTDNTSFLDDIARATATDNTSFLDDTDTDNTSFLDDIARATATDNTSFLDDIARATATDNTGFLDDIARATATATDAPALLASATESAPVSEPDTQLTQPMTLIDSTVEPVQLRDGDRLGPSFLTDTPQRKRRSGGRLRFVAFGLFMIAGLAAFGFGMSQLVGSLGEEPAEEVAVAAEPTPQRQATAVPAATATATATAVPVAVDPSAPVTAPAPPPPRLAVRLIDGSVMVATYEAAGVPPVFTKAYGPEDDEFELAANVAWLGDLLGVVDTDGNILVVDPTDRRPDPMVIYEASGGLAPAVEIEPVLGRVAVRTENGDISLIATNERADPDIIEFVWDAESEGSAATDISSVGDIVPFSLDTGDARMIVTSTDNSIVTLWLAREQPPVFNVDASSTGILMGIGQGAVARYRLGDVEGTRIEAVWDPFALDDAPAIGYGAAGDRTAVVLGDGAIVLVDETGTGPRIWEPEETELRAFSTLGTDTQAVVLLETGSVVRIPFSPDELIESVWDITDETLFPAAQIAIEER